nr:MAG TPA: hypothetical protein [Crassvirales sp.]
MLIKQLYHIVLSISRVIVVNLIVHLFRFLKKSIRRLHYEKH